MTELTCDICRDLIPLVVDGVASEDSEAAVKAHAASCAECGVLYREELERGMAFLRERTADEKILRSLRVRLAWQGLLLTFAALAVMMFVSRVFLLWMLPAVGAASYVLMRRYSVAVPVLAGAAAIVWYRDVWAGAVPGGLLCMGIVIAALLLFAFGKEKQHD